MGTLLSFARNQLNIGKLPLAPIEALAAAIAVLHKLPCQCDVAPGTPVIAVPVWRIHKNHQAVDKHRAAVAHCTQVFCCHFIVPFGQMRTPGVQILSHRLSHTQKAKKGSKMPNRDKIGNYDFFKKVRKKALKPPKTDDFKAFLLARPKGLEPPTFRTGI